MSDYNTYKKNEYQADLHYCSKFIFSFGSNYALATMLFSKKIREATIFFYSFVRYADELVDNPEIKMEGQTHNNLDEFVAEWEDVLKSGLRKDSHSILRSNYWLFKKYEIPFDYTVDFLSAMKQDIEKSRYQTYVELEKYMWGSASIIGHVMTHIVGYSDVIAFEHAKALSEGMQMANFLRDINEDYQERNRIYLPQDEMLNFGVTEEMIARQKMTPELYNLVHYYVEKAEGLFTKGINGIRYLESGRFSILLASRMYRENIRILKRRHYDLFGAKIRLSKSKKIQILLNTFVFYLLRGLK
ncbi:MAG: phytoene synthase [Flavobacteriaceae bacterium]|jgi:phytoene synthase